MSRPKATLGDGYPIQPGDGVTAFALHLAPDNAVFLRPIRRAHLLEAAGRCGRPSRQFPRTCAGCSADESPRRTFDGTPDARRAASHNAYPANAILDVNMSGEITEIRGDYFEGGFLRFVSVTEHPFLARTQNFVVSSPRLFRPS